MGTKCRALETTHQFLCFKGKCSNHFAFVFGRYLFPLFWFNLFNVDVNIVVYIHVIENSSQRFHLPNGSVDIDTTKHNSELVAFCKLIHCRWMCSSITGVKTMSPTKLRIDSFQLTYVTLVHCLWCYLWGQILLIRHLQVIKQIHYVWNNYMVGFHSIINNQHGPPLSYLHGKKLRKEEEIDARIVPMWTLRIVWIVSVLSMIVMLWIVFAME